MTRNYKIKRLTFTFDLDWCHTSVRVYDRIADRSFETGMYWNRLPYPSSWWWWHNNGGVKGVDNCYSFTSNFFIFHFNYTNFGLWRYKKQKG